MRLSVVASLCAVALLLAVATAEPSTHGNAHKGYGQGQIYHDMKQILSGTTTYRENVMIVNKNRYNADFFPPVNNSHFNGYIAGQEIRMRVRTIYFAMEDYRYSSGSIYDNIRNRPHNNKIQLARLFKIHRKIRGKNFFNVSRLNESYFPAFNVSGPSSLRVRVTAAYSTRTAMSGSYIGCAAQTDVWAEYWAMGGRNLAWGREMAFSATVTFVVPPFAFRVCIKDTVARNSTRKGQQKDFASTSVAPLWEEFNNVPAVLIFREPQYLWSAPTSLHPDDYAAIRVVVNGRGDFNAHNSKTFDPYDFSMSAATATISTYRGDFVKFVPAGLPCTYEKSTASAEKRYSFVHATASSLQYCGSNYVKAASGDFATADCVSEGSIAEGIAKTGSNVKNPFSTSTTPTTGEAIPWGQHLVAYAKLPAVGNYDLCFSPRAYRLSVVNLTATSAMPNQEFLGMAVPVWFKLFKADGSCPTSNSFAQVAGCSPRTMMLRTTAADNAVTFSSIDVTPGSWGTIMFTGSGLSTAAATSWEHSSTREYFSTVGGDQFRIVAESNFGATAIASTGDFFDAAGVAQTTSVRSADNTWSSVSRITASVTAANTLATSKEYTLIQYAQGKPSRGSFTANAGCWVNAADNYGDYNKALNGNPGSSCTGCLVSDTDDAGVTASANLGGDPRLPYSPWNADSTSTTNAYAYVRFPKWGKWRMCYRKAGTESWRAVPMTSATSVLTWSPRLDFDTFNYTFHINDTRANTWGAVRVISSGLDLTTENLNMWSTAATVPDASVVGSALKIVKNTASCYVDAGESRAFSDRPGAAQCNAGDCSGLESCAGCLGSAEDSSTKRRDVYFYVLMPSSYASVTSYYRVCFKKGLLNWNQIRDPWYRANQYSKNPWLFNPKPAPAIDYILVDNREATWGRFIFRRRASPSVTYTYATKYLTSLPENKNNDGDVFRLVINETQHGQQVNCDTTWGATSSNGVDKVQQNWVRATSVWDLGVWCASTTNTGCATTITAPTTNSAVNGMYPYATIDSTNDKLIIDTADGTAGFLTIPTGIWSTRPTAYKVCYKQAKMNWIEAIPADSGYTSAGPTYTGAYQPRYLPIGTKPLYSASVSHHAKVAAGMYGYIMITGSAAFKINPATDLVKLVLDTLNGCDRAAAGGLSYNNAYNTLAGSGINTRSGALIVDGASDTAAAASSQTTPYTSARAYITFPTIAGKTATATSYKVCYMVRASATAVTQNWQVLTTISVTSTGVAYTALNQPILGGAFRVRFLSGGTNPLNTTFGGDSAKLIDEDLPCFADDSVVPNGKTSYHTGLELQSATTSQKNAGIIDLGPTNEQLTTLSELETTLPYSSTAGLKVCYRLKGFPWVELEQAPAADLQYGLGSNGVYPDPSRIASFTIATAIRGQATSNTAQANYAGGTLAWTNAVIAGASTVKMAAAGNTSYFYATLSESLYPASTSDQWKLIPAATEGPVGVWRNFSVNCFTPNDALTGTIKTDTATTQGDIKINMPLTPGRYLLCYRRSSTSTWVQVQPASTAVGNPFFVIDSLLTFAADSTSQKVTVSDLWTFADQNQGGLTAADTVYMTNKSDVCGAAHSYEGTNFGNSATQLTLSDPSTSTNFMPRRSIATTAAWLSATTLAKFPGWMKMCVYRSQGAKVNNTDTTAATPNPAPFLQSGWYQVRNVGASATGGGTGFYISGGPTKLIFDRCPAFNMTYKIRTGKSFDMTVFTADASNTKIPFAVGTYAYEVAATVANTAPATWYMSNSFGGCLAQDAPNFGWDTYNNRQYTADGQVKFTISPISACPTGGCQLKFKTTTAGISDTTTCTFDVLKTVVDKMVMVKEVTECPLATKCAVRVAAYHTDGNLAYASVDTVTVVPTSFAGLGVKMTVAGTTSDLTGSATAGTMSQGFFDATFEFSVASGTLFAADTTVALAFNANQKNASTTMLVRRPKLSLVHIIDLYPSTVTTTTPVDWFIKSSLVPTWEPASTFTSYWKGGQDHAVDGMQAITASNGYHLVAQQFYTVVLRAVATVNGVNQYITQNDLLSGSDAITIDTTALTTAGNALYRDSGCSTATNPDGCTNALTAVLFTSAKQKVTFRLRNSKGCRKSAPCTIGFKFNAVDLVSATSITTPVRSVANKMIANCWADDGATGYDTSKLSGAATATLTAMTDACSAVSSTVENGWIVKAQAVDFEGDVDEWFNGNVAPVLKNSMDGLVTANGINLTTVANLVDPNQGRRLLQYTMSSGEVYIPTLTVSRPCSSGCGVQLISDWGADILSIGELKATTSTSKLRCTLATNLGKCTTDGTAGTSCGSVSGKLTYDSTTTDNNKDSLIYKDTNICVLVEAVNADTVPRASLYETNWVLYFAQAVSPASAVLTVTDSNLVADRRRYRPMFRSAVTFCFAVSGTFTDKVQFNMVFVAQRFNDDSYWSKGANGQCSVGTFTVWAKKHMADLRITKLSGLDSLNSLPSANAIAVGQRAGATDPALTVNFEVADHYGRSIASKDLYGTQAQYYVVISKCTADGLASSCVSGSVGAASGSPEVQLAGTLKDDGAERGVITVTVSKAPSARLDSATGVEYALSLAKYCIGCYLTFNVKDSSTDYKTKTISAATGTDLTLSAQLELNVLISYDATVTSFVLAYKRTTSPMSYWKKYESGSITASASVPPVLFKDTCWALTTAVCKPKENLFLLASCDPRSTTGGDVIGGNSATTAIRNYVVAAESSGAALDTTTAEPLCTSDDCTKQTNVKMQVDIMNSYSVSFGVGTTQILDCVVGYPCTNDGTVKPSQTITGYGATAKDAITAFKKASGAFRTTHFRVTGRSTSNYYTTGTDSTTDLAVAVSTAGAPSFSATINGTASITVTSLTPTGYGFAFRGPAIARRFVVLPVAKEAMCPVSLKKYPCLSSSATGPCVFNGYENSSTLDSIAFPYATTTIPVGIAFPISAQIVDAQETRVWTAGGTVAVELVSWAGCNNGGTMTISGTSNNKDVTVDNGIATAWISFSAPCQSCLLKFTLTPSTSQASLYSQMNANPGSLMNFSKPITVTGAVVASRVLVTSLPADQPNILTIADTVALTVANGGSVGNLLFREAATSSYVAAYNTIQSTTQNWWWVGNGGVLRADKAKAFIDRHANMKAFIGSGAISFMFTRACQQGCSVTIFYNIANGAQWGSFLVQNKISTVFTVNTALAKAVLVGYRPRTVLRGQPVGAALWHVGAELAGEAVNPIDVTGIASTEALAPATVTASPKDALNGAGGNVLVTSWKTSKAEMHRISFSDPCNNCQIGFSGGDKFNLNVYTVATHIRPVLAQQLLFQKAYPMAATDYFAFQVRAVDNDAFIDVKNGGYSLCQFSLPFQCSPPTSVVAVTMAADGYGAAFVPADTGFQSIAPEAIAASLNDAAKTIVDGQGSVQFRLSSPVRNSVPIFSAGALSSTLVSSRPMFAVPIIDVKTANDKLAVATSVSPAVDKVVAFQTFTIYAGLVRSIDSTTSKYVAADADNLITLTFDANCPARDANSKESMPLVKGITKFMIQFQAGTVSGKNCGITVKANTGMGSCAGADCQALLSVTVSSITASKWNWQRPTIMDNAPSTEAGPQFGVAGRRSYLSVGLQGVDSTGATTQMKTCDDPTTPSTVETCTFTVEVGAACTNKPTIVGSPANFDEFGSASVTVQWLDSTTVGSYQCALTASVKRGTTILTAPATGPGSAPAVTVCKPSKLVLVTNVTSVFKGKPLLTGVAYPFYAVLADAQGVHCRGDSQDDATDLKVDIVSAAAPLAGQPAGSATLVSPAHLAGFNVNVSRTDSMGLAEISKKAMLPRMPENPNAEPHPRFFVNQMKAVAGGFQFSVVFSNSTQALAAAGVAGFESGVRVRISASSPTPKFESTVISGPVQTMMAASKLRFRPDSILPPFAVTGRPIQAANGTELALARIIEHQPDFLAGRKWMPTEFAGSPRKSFVVQAVDDLEAFWDPSGRAPNVARGANDRGNAAQVTWNVEPRVDGGLPITFATGSSPQTLVNGEALYSNLVWTARDGPFAINVAADNMDIKPSRPYLVTMQKPVKLLINTSNFRPDSFMGGCGTGCTLPNSTFDVSTENATLIKYLNGSSLKAFNVTVFVADANGLPVMGDFESVIEVSLNKPIGSKSNIVLAQPPAFATVAPFRLKVRNGQVTFLLGFTGSTEEKDATGARLAGNHSRVEISFSCSKTSLDGTTNPCLAENIGAATSATILIGDNSINKTLFSSSKVTAAKKVVKIPTGFTDLTQFNGTQFECKMAEKLASTFPYINCENAGKVLPTLSCQVKSAFGDSDLTEADPDAKPAKDGVCGPKRNCEEDKSNSDWKNKCPDNVEKCDCPDSVNTKTASLLSRYLLQASPAGASSVQAEMKFDLSQAAGFTGSSEDDLVKAYTTIADTVTTIAKTDTEFISQFKIDKSKVGAKSASAPGTTPRPASPNTTASPPRNATPPTPGTGSTGGTPAKAGAPALTVVLAVLLGALLALLA